jgi:hypothetical protein
MISMASFVDEMVKIGMIPKELWPFLTRKALPAAKPFARPAAYMGIGGAGILGGQRVLENMRMAEQMREQMAMRGM